MTTTQAMLTIFESLFIAFTLWALFNENKIARYEKIIFRKIKRFFKGVID